MNSQSKADSTNINLKRENTTNAHHIASEIAAMTASQIDKSLHEKFKTYGQNAKEWMRKCALLLPEIARRKIWKKKGFGSLHEYAGKLAGMSRRQVDDAIWYLTKLKISLY